jgi:hypothetical protein
MKKVLSNYQVLELTGLKIYLHEIFLLIILYAGAGFFILQNYINPALTNTYSYSTTRVAEPTEFCSPPPSPLLSITALGTSGQRGIPVGSNITGIRRWSQTASWPNGVKPGINDDVVIAANTMLVLDENVNVKSITVNGQLIIDITKNIQVSTNYLLVSGAGAYFEWGTENEKYEQKGAITLTGDVSTTNATLKSVLINNGGRAEFHGKAKKSWTTLAANVTAGSNQIQITDNAHQWEVGDEIVIVSSRVSQNEAEKRTITAISTDRRTLTLNTNLRFPHIGNLHTYYRSKDGKSWTADMRAEVGLLTKNIKIQGDNASTVNGGGGHMMVHTVGIANLENVELYRMGQKSILARYPFHWHLLENRGQGQYFRNNSVHESYNRAITIHGTESATVENNFCYDHLGHGIFLEDGSERFNIIRNNVVVLTKRPKLGEEVIPSDNEANEVQNRTPSSYWITNPNNTFEGNIAAGTEGTGFWFAMPQAPMGLSAGVPRFAGIQPFREPLGIFRNNKAHSCMSGFDIFDQLNPKHSLAKNGAWDRTDFRLMQSCTWYACDLAVYGGIGGGRRLTENVIFRDNIFVDNVTAVMHANYSMIENSVFVANSGENVFNGERKLNRGYDGSCYIKDCHMVGWQAGNANYVQNTGGAKKHVNYRISGMTMDHPGPPRMSFPDYSVIPRGGVGANDIAHPRFWSYIHWDIDGSVSGKANTSIVTNHPLCRDGSEVRYENWTNLFRTDRRFAYMVLDFPGDPKMTIVRTKAGTPKAGQYYINTDGPEGYYGTFIHFPVMVNDGFLYTLQFESMGTSKNFNLHMMDDYVAGDQVLYRIKSFGALAGLNVSNATRYNTLAQLRAATQSGFAIDNGDLYIKMVSVASTPDIVCTVSWTGNITLPLLDTDGDGISDYQETVNGTDPVGNDPIPVNPVLSIPTIKTVWEFNTNGNAEGWNTINNLTGNVTNGRIGLQVTGTDPQFISPTNLLVPAKTYPYLKVRVRSANAGQLQLYWSRDGGNGFSQSRFEALPIKAVGTSYLDYYFDLSANPEWINNINQLRIDPEVGTGQSVEIDRISFETSRPPCTATITASAITACQGSSITLTANNVLGADYVWRNGNTVVGGNSNILTVTSTGNYTVEITSTTGCMIRSNTQTITIQATPQAPTVTTPVTYCQGAAATALTATGTNLKWYTVATGGTALSSVPIPSTATVGTTNYYVSQTTGSCESPRALIAVTVNATPQAPTVNTPVTYCQGGTATALTANGTNLKWYTVATGGTALSSVPIPSTATVGTTNYYVSQTTGSCESPRALIAVTVNATPQAPTVTTPVTYCQGATATALTANGTNLKWYNVATGGTALSSAPIPSTATVGTTNYYVSQTTGSCESPRALIAVTVNATPLAPTVTTPVIHCQGAAATALTATGTNLKWYTVATGGTALSSAPIPSTATVGTTNYYVSQTTGSCESPRALIAVVINSAPQATISPSTTQWLNVGENILLTATSGAGYNYQWMNNGAPIPGATSSTYTVMTAGQYQVSVNNSSECSRLSLMVEVKDNSPATVDLQTQVDNGVVNTINILVVATDPNGIAGVDIYDGTTLVTTLTQSPYQYNYTNVTTGNHTIRVVVRDIQGGITEQSKIVTVTGVPTSIQRRQIEGLEYYPNPFNDNITIKVDGSFRYMLLDSKGVKVKEGEATNIDVIGEDLPGGMYMLMVQQLNVQQWIKIDKVK